MHTYYGFHRIKIKIIIAWLNVLLNKTVKSAVAFIIVITFVIVLSNLSG